MHMWVIFSYNIAGSAPFWQPFRTLIWIRKFLKGCGPIYKRCPRLHVLQLQKLTRNLLALALHIILRLLANGASGPWWRRKLEESEKVPIWLRIVVLLRAQKQAGKSSDWEGLSKNEISEEARNVKKTKQRLSELESHVDWGTRLNEILEEVSWAR